MHGTLPRHPAMRPRVILCCGLSFVCACSRAPLPAPESGQKQARLLEESNSSATEPPSQSKAPSSVQEPNPVAHLKLVSELDCDEALLHVLPEKTFLSCGQRLMVIDGDTIREDPSYERGIEPEQPVFASQIASISGRWPAAVWLGSNRSTVDAAEGRFFHFDGQRWEKAGKAGHDEPLSELLPWTNERVMALVQPALGFGARFIPLGKPAFNTPTFTPPALPHPHCRSRLRAEVQTALAPGELLVAGGQVCDVVERHGERDTVHAGIGVERFSASAPKGELMLLDGPPDAPPDAVWEVTALVSLGPTTALLAAHARIGARSVGYLARWDGTSLKPEPLPFPEGIDRLWLDGSDGFWATDLEGRLWRRHDQIWQQVAWQPPDPTDQAITRVWARDASEIWILIERPSQHKSALFHGRAP